MNPPFQDVIARVNSLLDAREIIRLLAFKPEGLTVLGNRLKAFCPVDRGGTFKSLQIDPAARTCQCIVKGCAVSESSTLLELVARARKLPPLAAALDLVREFNLALPEGTVEAIAEHHARRAQEVLATRNFAEAKNLLAIARSADPENVLVARTMATAVERSGAPAVEVVTAYMDAARLAERREQLQLSAEILHADLLRLDPSHIEALGMLSDAQRVLLPDGILWAETRLRRSRALIEAGRVKEGYTDLQVASGAMRKDPGVHIALAETSVKLDRLQDASREYLAAAQLLYDEGFPEEAAEQARHALDVDPQHRPARQFLTHLLAESGDAQAYALEMEMLSRDALAAGDFRAADEAAETLLQTNPGHMGATELLIEIAERRGDHDALAKRLLAAARTYRISGNNGARDAAIDRLRSRELRDPSLQRELADELLASGRNDAAAVEYFNAGAASLILSDWDLATAAFGGVEKSAPLDIERNSAIVVALRNADQRAAADEFLARLITRLHAHEANTQIVEVLDALLEPGGEATALHQARLEALFDLQSGDRFVQEALTLHAILLAQGKLQEDAYNLLRALEFSSENPTVLESLCGVYLADEQPDEAIAMLDRLAKAPTADVELRLRAATQSLDLRPGDAPTLVLCAQLSEEHGDAAKAARHYEDAASAYLQVGKTALGLEAMEEAARLAPGNLRLGELAADLALNAGDRPRALVLYHRYLDAQVAAGPDEDTAEAFEGIETKLPDEFDFRRRHAGWLHSIGNTDAAADVAVNAAKAMVKKELLQEARATLLETLVWVPARYSAADLLARIHLKLGERTEAHRQFRANARIAHELERDHDAVTSLEEAAAIEPIESNELLFLADRYEERPDSEACARVLCEIDARNPDAPADERLPLLDRILRHDRANRRLRLEFARLLEETRQSDFAATQYEWLAEDSTDTEEFETYLAKAAALDPRRRSIRLKLADSFKRRGDSEKYRDALIAIAEECQAEGDRTEALAIARDLRDEGPENPVFKARLGTLLEAAGDTTAAVEQWYFAVALYEAAGDSEAAITLLQHILDSVPDEMRVREHLASVFRRMGRTAEAITQYRLLLRQLVRTESDLAESVIGDLEALIGFDWVTFEDLLGELVLLGLKEPALEAAERFYERASEAEEFALAVEACEYVRREGGETVDLAGVLGELLVRSGQNERGEAALLRRLALLEDDHAKPAALLEACGHAVELLPNSPSLQLALFDARLVAGEAVAARVALPAFLASMRGAHRSNEGLAAMHRLAEALPKDTELRFEYADALLAAHREGEAHIELRHMGQELSRENPKVARRALERLLDLLPESEDDLKSLVALVMATEGREAARPLAARTLSLIATRDADVENFVQHAEPLLTADPENVALHRRYAEILRERGQAEASAEVIEKLARNLHSSGDALGELELLELLAEWRPEHEPTLRQLVDAAAAAGERDRALKALKTLEQLAQGRGERSDVITALRAILRFEPEDVERLEQLAELLGDAGDTEGRLVALGDLRTLYTNRGDRVGTERTLRAMVALRGEDPALLASFAEVLTELGNKAEAADILVRIADLHLAAGHDSEAIAALQSARTNRPDDRELRARILEALEGQRRFVDLVAEAKLLVEMFRGEGEEWEVQPALAHYGAMLLADHEPALTIQLLADDDSLVTSDTDLLRLRAEARTACRQVDVATGDWVRLSHLLREHGELTAAEDALVRAIDLDPKETMLRLSLIDLLRAHKGSDPARIAQHLRELATISAAQNKPDQAAQALQQLVESGEGDIDSYRMLGTLYLTTGKRAEALATHLQLGALCLAGGDLTGAENAYLLCLRHDAMNAEALKGLLDTYELRGDAASYAQYGMIYAELLLENYAPDDAREVLRRIAALDPTHEAAREHLARLAEKAGDNSDLITILGELYTIHANHQHWDHALEILHRMEELDAENRQTLERLGSLYLKLKDDAQAGHYLRAAAEKAFALGEFEDALRLAEQLTDLLPHDESIRTLRISLFEQAGKREAAVAELRELATIQGQSEEPEEQLATLQHILKIDPGNIAIREEVALLLSDLDEPVAAVEQFLLVADEWERRGALPKAVDAASTATTLAPDSRPARERLAKLYELTGDRIRSAQKYLALAAIVQEGGDLGASIELLEHANVLDPSADLLIRIARLNLAAGHSTRAAVLFAQVAAEAQRTGKEGLAREALIGSFELEPTNIETLRGLTEQLLTEENHARIEQLYLRTFSALLAQGDIEKAREVFAEHFPNSPDPVALHIAAADIYERNDIPELAARELLDAAKLIRQDGSLLEALKHSTRSLELKPNDQPAMTLKYDLLVKLDRSEEAAALGTQLATLHMEREEYDVAIEIARQLIRMRPKDPAHRRLLISILGLKHDTALQVQELRELADLFLPVGDLDKAMEVLKEILTIRPDDTRARIHYIDAYRQVGPELDLVQDYLKLAEIHSRNGAILEANKLFEKLLHLDAKQPEIHDRFIQYLIRHSQSTRAILQTFQLAELYHERGEPRRALESLERVRGLVAADPEFHIRLGRTHLALNARGTASREMKRAAELYHEAGNAMAEASVLRELLVVDPMNLEIRQALIDALLAANQREDALNAMEDLGNTYLSRGLPDLAVAEYRRLLKIDQERPSVWQRLFEGHLQISPEEELIPDYLEYAEMMARFGEVKTAIDYYSKVVGFEPRNIRARRGFITQYPKIGKQSDIVDEILELAQLIVETGDIDEAARYFELVMSVDPQNTLARDMLSQTQARSGSDVLEKLNGGDGKGGMRISSNEFDLSESQARALRDSVNPAANFLQGTIDAMEKQESEATLSQVVSNYRDMLAVNENNANVRIKLADVLEQMGRIPEMLQELAAASETLFKKDDLAMCITVCERFLRTSPNDGKVRKRLNEAVLKRTAFKALESAIFLTGKEE